MADSVVPVGLRVDVDTLRGTRRGVPALLSIFASHRIRASFFFSLGPDNMGRHLWRLRSPAFAVKMMRTRAASLYGWDIVLRGLLWPGPVIAASCAEIVRDTDAAGHEVGLHAWDHHRWQARAASWDEETAARETGRGFDSLAAILGRPPVAAAAPAWRATVAILAARERFRFRYLSDCRGHGLFRPIVAGRAATVQVPTTLPTYDEAVGRVVDRDGYNDWLLGLVRPGRLNVLTVHAEAEGIACRGLFEDFLLRARDRGLEFVPLGDLVAGTDPPPGRMGAGLVEGRDGWVAVQEGGG